RHTRSDRDWSSDVCSSDLFFRGDELGVVLAGRPGDELLRRRDFLRSGGNGETPRPQPVRVLAQPLVGCERETDIVGDLGVLRIEIGRASCRERVWVSVWVG